MTGEPRWRCASLGCALLLALGCSRKTEQLQPPAPKPSAAKPFKPAAAVASGLPGVADQVSKVVNPENKPAYAGPSGSVRGVVTATGDQAPIAKAHLDKIQGACPEAREAYARVFREGMMRSLADVLVAVTGYAGYVPEKAAKQVVAARGCAFSTRTIALTFGQTIDVVSKDAETYVPNLLGSSMRAQLLALPGSQGATLYPPQVGQYVLTDDIKVFMLADVFVLKYATHDVTGLDGRFEIEGIPVGPARVSALLPGTGAVIEKDIVIQADKPLELSLELPFDAKAFAARSAAAASASAAPAGSALPPRASASGR